MSIMYYEINFTAGYLYACGPLTDRVSIAGYRRASVRTVVWYIDFAPPNAMLVTKLYQLT